MKIFIIERDHEEIEGIKWYLKTYITSNLEIKSATDCSNLAEQLEHFQPQVLLVEMELITAEIEKLLKQQPVPIIGLTAEPIFQQAMKAIRIRALDLFIKPIPLEQLKSTLLTLPVPKEGIPITQSIPLQTELYADLYLNHDKPFCLQKKAFFLIECADFKNNLSVYHWLIHSPIFNQITALPLQKRLICIVDCADSLQLSKQLRLLIQEWTAFSGYELNIALYDGEETTFRMMYEACKRVLIQRFYKGYSHLFKSSQSLSLTRFDPLLTPEQQQLWIDSLEKNDMKSIKAFLYQLINVPPFYHYDDVRIHLTSVLAQIRRFMLKYQLQQAKLEEQYRTLFHHILEHPNLYAIVQEFILFTQQLIQLKSSASQLFLGNYDERAIEYIEANYSNSELSLTIVANALNINANYFSSFFSKKRGISFKKFLQQYRVQKGANLLLESNFSVASVAEAVGFVDSNYFIKVFRDYYGITPARYRIKKKSL